MSDRIFLDTTPLIYLIEDIPPFAEKFDGFIYSEWESGAEFYTSTITGAKIRVLLVDDL